MRVTNPDGVGTIDNVYVEDVKYNFMFCHAYHEGHIDITNSTFINNLRDEEDTLYGSPPGNPDANWGKDTGRGGTIRVEGCYTERIGGYGWRLGSDSSKVVNCTLVDMERVGLAKSRSKPEAASITRTTRRPSPATSRVSAVSTAATTSVPTASRSPVASRMGAAKLTATPGNSSPSAWRTAEPRSM